MPATQANLPAIDPDADRFIGDQFNANPAARYRITQMAFVQEAALAEAQNRIKRLEYDLQQAQQTQQQAAPQSRGLFGGLFGGGQQQGPAYQPQYAPPPPQPAYPPGYQPGMFRSGGSGFLGSALTTAAGVAGGVLAADALTSMFSGHGGGWGGGGFGGGGFGGGEVVNETVVNNYGPQDGSGGADPMGRCRHCTRSLHRRGCMVRRRCGRLGRRLGWWWWRRWRAAGTTIPAATAASEPA